MGNANFLIKICYVVMLGVIGVFMFAESLQSLRKAKKETTAPEAQEAKKESLYARTIKKLPWQMDFERSGVRFSVLSAASYRDALSESSPR